MSRAPAEFSALVARMEQAARARPAAYRRRVFALAALGYGYLLAVVMVLVALTALAGISVIYLKAAGVKLLVVVGAVLWAVLRSLWVKQEVPKAPVVTRAQAPALFAMLDRLREKLQTPSLHEVQVTKEFNAGVTQVPRLGLFGWHRNYLIVGLPLMKALSVSQFESVLAHELGHLSHGHARAANWIYRLRLIWTRLEQALAGRSQWGSWLTRPFYRWYIPYFAACSFPLARSNEFEADAAAVRVTSRASVAQALTSVSVIGSWTQEHYWPGIHAAAKDAPQPLFSPFSNFDGGKLQAIAAGDVQRSLNIAMARKTSTDDTHPALCDRLAAVGAEAALVTPRQGERADQLLGARGDKVAAQFDEEWRAGVAEAWRLFHERTQKEREALVGLRAKSDAAQLNEAESLQLAHLEQSVGAGEETALRIYREVHARFPGSAPACFALGRQLLGRSEAEGVKLVESAVASDAEAILPGSELLRDYYWRQGDPSRASFWQEKYLERAALLRAAAAERQRLTLKDRYLPHGLDEAQLSALVAQFKGVPGLRRVYLVRKAVEFFPEQPQYLVGFRVTPWYRWTDRATGAVVMQALRAELSWPGPALIVNVEGKNYKFDRKFRRAAGARVYQAANT